MNEHDRLAIELAKVKNRTSIVKEYDDKPTKFKIPATNYHKEYKCNLCNDKGIISEIIDGKRYGRPCECAKKRQRERLIENSGLKEKFDTNRLVNFIHIDKWQDAIYNSAINYIKSSKGSYFISGKTGSGKTHICTAICKELLDRDYQVLYTKYNLLFKSLVAAKNKFQKDYDKELYKYTKVEVLYIDDLFKLFNDRDIVNLDVMFDLIDARYSQNKRTIFSTEMNINEIGNLESGAIAGRIYEMCKGNMIDVGNLKERNMRVNEIKRKRE